MKIYDLNKIESDEVRELLINSLPKRVKTLDGSTLITSKNIIANEIKSPIIHLNDHKFTNPITISNIEIKNNFIIGDISLGTYNPHFNNYNSPDGSCSAVDLRKTNKYQISINEDYIFNKIDIIENAKIKSKIMNFLKPESFFLKLINFLKKIIN